MQDKATPPSLQQRLEKQQATMVALRSVPLFREVPDEALASLAATSVRQILGRGNILWQPNDVIDAVFVLIVGVIRLYRHLENGAEVTVALLCQRQIGGLTDLGTAFMPTTVAQALSDETIVYRIPRRSFTTLLANPDIVLRIVAAAGERIQDAYDLLTLRDMHARVAYVLVHLTTINDERMVWATHEELATWAGGRREVLTREVLPDLRRRGLIAYQRHRRGIRVLDYHGLRALITVDYA